MKKNKRIALGAVVMTVGALALGLATACSGGSAGTCASTCKKSIALNCSAGEKDQAACEASCAKQQNNCNAKGQGNTFQTYLDCIESNPMECGSTTQAPSSPACVQQGLAIFACALSSSGDAGGGG